MYTYNEGLRQNGRDKLTTHINSNKLRAKKRLLFDYLHIRYVHT